MSGMYVCPPEVLDEATAGAASVVRREQFHSVRSGGLPLTGAGSVRVSVASAAPVIAADAFEAGRQAERKRLEPLLRVAGKISDALVYEGHEDRRGHTPAISFRVGDVLDLFAALPAIDKEQETDRG